MACKKLLDNQSYEHKICGMLRDLAVEARSVLRTPEEAAKLAAKAKGRVVQLLSSNPKLSSRALRVSVAVGSFGLDAHIDSEIQQLLAGSADQPPEVVIWLLSDPTDIDSKQVTFVHKASFAGDMSSQDAIFSTLYKAELLHS